MRLLDARSLIHEGVARLVDDAEVEHPHYAILSHTWSQEEVLFEDIKLGPDFEVAPVPSRADRETRGYSEETRNTLLRSFTEMKGALAYLVRDQRRARAKLGWNKVYNACLRACYDNLDYIWIDNCCINKDSSAELTEAINAMYTWYAGSSVCYVYLEDCRWCPNADFLGATGHTTQSGHASVDPCSKAQLKSCRWLTRGWTLQELIAPNQVLFLDQMWTQSPYKDIGKVICKLAGVPPDLACFPVHADRNEQTGMETNVEFVIAERRSKLQSYTIAERMSWAAHRQTTRVEDTAYSLLGLFDVNMPLLYGEGEKAFTRLQRALIETSTDSSLFAWDGDVTYRTVHLLARSPNDFGIWKPGPSEFEIDHSEHKPREICRQAFLTNSEGLSITLPLVDDGSSSAERPRLPENWDPRLSNHTSFALLKGRVLGPEGVGQTALRLRHWTRDSAYVFSEVVPRNEWFGETRRNRAGLGERLSVLTSDELTTSTTHDLFILWDAFLPSQEEANLVSQSSTSEALRSHYGQEKGATR